MKKFEMNFIEEPEVITGKEMSEILGGNSFYQDCNCVCKFNLRVINDGKERRTKLLTKNQNGFCFIVSVEVKKNDKKSKAHF